MEHQITLRVRPGQSVRFPSLCVACSRPMAERLTLQLKRGQLTRCIEVPICEECRRLIARRSGEEERLIRLSRLAGLGVGIILALLVAWVLPLDVWALRLAAGVLFGIAGGALVYRVLARRAAAAELPERRAVREAACIIDFNWRDMTLAFADPGFAERVRELNSSAVISEAHLDEEAAVVEHETAAEVSPPPADE